MKIKILCFVPFNNHFGRQGQNWRNNPTAVLKLYAKFIKIYHQLYLIKIHD